MELINRPRRLRQNDSIRRLCRETRLSPDSLIYPIFVDETLKGKRAIPALDGQFHYGLDAVCEAVEQICGVRPGLKWPNDPVLNGKKLCGILTELSLEAETGQVQYLVLGIGVNVLHRPEDFSEDVAQVATSLAMELGHPVSRPALAAAEIRALDRLYGALESGDLAPWLEAYRRDCVTLGHTVQILSPDGRRETVEALDVDEQFGLVVRRQDGTKDIIRSGEVSVRGMYGYVE